MFSLDFISILDKEIERMGITRNKMLNELGLNRNSFGNWLNRGNIPSGDEIAKMAKYFNVSTDYLLGNDSSGTVTPASKAQVKLAIFGTSDIDDETYEEALIQAQTAKLIREQRNRAKEE
jgi:transcriptional regulator with XRE-family HTH domain